VLLDDENVPLLSGLSEIAENYSHFVIDLWGVIHNGVELSEHAHDTLNSLSKEGKDWVFVTNTSPAADYISSKMVGMGLPEKLHKAKIITAGDSAHSKLSEYNGQRCMFFGLKKEVNLPEGMELLTTSDPSEAGFIFNCIGAKYSTENPQILNEVKKGLEFDLPMVCTNPDIDVDHGGTIAKCAGYYADWYEKNGGKVFWFGKPHKPIYEKAFEKLGQPEKQNVLAIGDSLRTDISGAKKYGIDAVWNLDGTTKNSSLKEARRLLTENKLRPIGILQGFRW
tara:strand:+ start:101 stop:943 length:843 start_codon:yes stop_codon:yes gene_type:complete